MKPSLKQLRRHFSHAGVKDLIVRYNELFNGNYEIHRIWQHNFYELADILDVLGYRGELSYHAVKRFMDQRSEQKKRHQKQQDDELFKNIASMKKQQKQKKQQKKSYKQSIRDTATAERELMNISYE